MSKPGRQALTKLRDRAEAAVARRVRYWVAGSDAVFPGDPHRRITVHPTSYAPVTLLQYGPDDGEPVTVGKFCAVHRTVVVFHGGNHRIDFVGLHNTRWVDGELVAAEGSPTSRGPVVIGNDVWVGYEALLLSGVTIGDGAVVSARALITRNVEPYEIVGGNPARHIGWRFDEPTREALLRIRWWDWPEELVWERIGQINSPDVAGFIGRYDPAVDSESAGGADATTSGR